MRDGTPDGFLGRTDCVRYKVGHFRVATALFLRPNNTELDDRYVPARSSCRYRLCEGRREKLNQLAVFGRSPDGLDLGVRQDTAQPGHAGHDSRREHGCQRIGMSTVELELNSQSAWETHVGQSASVPSTC